MTERFRPATADLIAAINPAGPLLTPEEIIRREIGARDHMVGLHSERKIARTIEGLRLSDGTKVARKVVMNKWGGIEDRRGQDVTVILTDGLIDPCVGDSVFVQSKSNDSRIVEHLQRVEDRLKMTDGLAFVVAQRKLQLRMRGISQFIRARTWMLMNNMVIVNGRQSRQQIGRSFLEQLDDMTEVHRLLKAS